ncbi:MAG: peptide chain release factor 2 [Verrucomicrobia bacterium]|nr:peptide chain release factor 2 [Verrucomicrobiota bacterium]
MEENIEKFTSDLENRILHMWRYLDLAQKEEEVARLESKMQEGVFWENQEEAKKTIDRSKALKAWTVPYQDLKRRFSDVKALLPEVLEVKDEELLKDLRQELIYIDKTLSELEIRKMLSGEMDPKNCYLSINSGAGGTEACDWALMLCRMYQRWATKRGWGVEVLDTVDGDVAGIKSTTLKIIGEFAYGYCKSEKGVHRLVRISPFDSNAKRHTSFASVDITPEIDDDINIAINPDEIRIDTYRASGAGGQHVNKTDSAVRITHIPTGIVVSCQGERSQLQNKETCFKMLRAKLYEKEVEERKEKLKNIGGEKMENAWGSQIRNYVFQPYTLVKDARTKYEVGNAEAVLDGDLDGFINAYLKEFG